MAEIPVPAPNAAKMRATDIDLLEADARRALVADRPATDALWAALLKPRDVVLREYVANVTRVGGSETNPVMLELMTPDGRPMGDGPPALIAMANTLVAKAILGDERAASQVMTRIEGTPAKRKGDEDDDKERGVLMAALSELVDKMYDQAERRPGDMALDITPPKKPTNGSSNGHDPA